MTRRLSLSRETLTELTAVELAGVAGAQQVSGTCTTVLTFLTCNVTCMTEV